MERPTKEIDRMKYGTQTERVVTKYLFALEDHAQFLADELHGVTLKDYSFVTTPSLEL